MVDVPALRAGLVVRQRLHDSLRLTPDVRLILVAAPAGFGKTTLLADWVRLLQVPSAWVSLSPTDDDPALFARHVIGAISGPPGPISPPAIATGSGVGLEEMLAAIVHALESRPHPLALVLDDFHVVRGSVQALVARLLERLPPGVVLVLGARADPPLPLARLRARGQLVEVRGEALRFTSDEAARFLRETLGLRVTESQATALAARTEGWAAGLQLAGLALRERPDADVFIEEFSGTHRFVLDYLVDEVLALQPDDVQAFLLETSLLDRLSAELCDAVTGRADGQAMLERLERENLFVIRLDEERRSYRYHHLFADLLRARLRRARPDDEPMLHSRAAAWFHERGAADEAIRHALAADDLGLAIDVIGGHWVTYGHRGEVATVRRWLDALPPDVVRRDPLLSTAYAWMLVLAGHREGVLDRVRDAEVGFAGLEQAAASAWVRSVPAQLALLRSSLADAAGDAAAAQAQASLALASIPADLEPELASVIRGEAAVTLGHALASLGDPEGAAAAYGDALPLLWAGGNPFGAGMAAMRLADVEAELGRLDVAQETCRATLRRAKAAHLEDAPAMAAVHVALGRLLFAGGDAQAALSEASRGLELARRGGQLAAARAAEQLSELVRSRDGSATWSPAANASLAEPLTARELDVLRLLAAGRSNRQIADELFLSVGTVKFYVHAVLGKLGATSRLEVAARARALGLVS